MYVILIVVRLLLEGGLTAGSSVSYTKHSMIDWSGYIVQADTSVLNLPVEKMDYYVPG